MPRQGRACARRAVRKGGTQRRPAHTSAPGSHSQAERWCGGARTSTAQPLFPPTIRTQPRRNICAARHFYGGCTRNGFGFHPNTKRPLGRANPWVQHLSNSLRLALSGASPHTRKMGPWEQPSPSFWGLDGRTVLPLFKRRREITALPAQPPVNLQPLGRSRRLHLRAVCAASGAPPQRRSTYGTTKSVVREHQNNDVQRGALSEGQQTAH